MPTPIGEKIKKLRNSAKMSQEEFAKMLGMSRVTFAQIEQGERDVKHTELQTIARNFEMSLTDLISDDRIEPTPPQAGKDQPFYKFKQTFLYILNKCAQKPNIGKTVINKLLYFADFDYYEKHWTSITGVDYVKMPRGPVPQVMEMVIAQMEKENQIKQIDVPYFQYTQTKVIPLVMPDMTILQGDELAEIDAVINKYGDWNAEKLSEWSHGDMPWKATKQEGAVISYGLVGYRDEPYIVTQRDGDED